MAGCIDKQFTLDLQFTWDLHFTLDLQATLDPQRTSVVPTHGSADHRAVVAPDPHDLVAACMRRSTDGVPTRTAPLEALS
jgi:hypothetical protein